MGCTTPEPNAAPSFLPTLAEAEKQLLHATLAYYGNNKRKTAESMGVSLKTVYNMLARYPTP